MATKQATKGKLFKAETAWQERPDLVRQFVETRPSYEQLCSEIAYTLAKEVEKNKIPVAAITNRAKDLASFLEKAERKSFTDPMKETTDLGGTRVVCYYSDDVPKVDRLIYEDFEVVEKEDKTTEAGVERFGYGGIHYVVRLSSKFTGARYDDLRDLRCEIQVRTVMQDAWAILSHHLLYKREEDTPGPLRRSVNALAGALDTADLAFKAIREERDEYLSAVSATIAESRLQKIEVNVDSIPEYARSRYPNLPYVAEGKRDWTEWIVQHLLTFGHKDLSQVDDLLNRTEAGREWLASERPVVDSQYELIRAIYIAIPASRSADMPGERREHYEKAAAL